MKLKISAFVGLILFSFTFFMNLSSKDKVSLQDTKKKEKNSLQRSPASSEISQKKENQSKPDLVRSLEKLKTCYKSKCNFPDKDPRMHDLLVGQEIKKEIFELTKLAKEQTSGYDYSSLAREFIQIEDGHVKEAALSLLATQDISKENFESIVQNVLLYHDDALIDQAMMELERYKTSGYENETTQAIEKSFSGASPMIRERLAKNVYPFISEENRETFRDISKRDPWNSKSAKILRANLRRFEREHI